MLQTAPDFVEKQLDNFFRFAFVQTQLLKQPVGHTRLG